MKQLINKVEKWFVDRILHTLNGAGQLTKLTEEVRELEDAFITDDRAEEIDAVGDIMVVLIGYCMQRDLDITDCLASAYEKIKDRKGKVVDGVFVKKGEGNAMKKDIEWLKREIPKLRGYAVVIDEIDGGLNPVITISLKDVYRLINQLDEPEVTHEQVVEWIENNEFYCHATAEKVLENAVDKGELGYYGTKYSVVEKPVIPKYVADWITQYRRVFDLYPALKRLEESPLCWERIYKWYRINTHKFVNAYLTGEYEVEEEPLYYASIKGYEFPSGRLSLHDGHLTKMSKEDWNEFGVNDSNADFVKVDE